MSEDTGARRCNATVDGKARCGFAGTQDELAEHAEETRHWLCSVCVRSLRDDESRVCVKCVQRTRSALTLIRTAHAHLERAAEATALHPGSLPGGTALVMLADGNMAAPRPYKPGDVTDRPAVDYPRIPGTVTPVHWYAYDHRADKWERHESTTTTTHPEYTDTRPVPDGTEHYADHWVSDPTTPLAWVDSAVRAWRILFAHPIPDDLPTVDTDIDYLLIHLRQAARADDTFPEFTEEVTDLAWRLAHIVGIVNDPVTAAANCFDCGGQLVSEYREPRDRRDDHRMKLTAILAQRAAERSYGITTLTPLDRALVTPGTPREGREMVDGDLPVWVCRDCDGIYEPASYWLAVRAVLEAQAMAS